MIPRTLVPRDVRPPKPEDLNRPASRLTTYMDDRTVIPAGPSDAPPLDGRSNIPEHLPLDVLVDRTLVPRGMAVKPLERSAATQEAGVAALDFLEARLVVPAQVKPLEPEQQQRPLEMTAELREVIEPDIFITGDANLLIEPEEKHDAKWDHLARAASILAHIALVLFLVNLPNIFKQHVPTQEEINLAQKQLSFIYSPPPSVPKPPTPKMPRVDPKMLERIAPPVEKPIVPELQPQPQPVKPQQELPEAPTPHTPAAQPPPQVAQNQPPPQQPSQLEPIKPQPNPHLNLQLPDSSPGRTLQNQVQDAIKRGGTGQYFPPQGMPNPGGGRPSVGNSVTILTPTQGVDFNSYIQRMLATIKRNWDAVIPQSAMMGEQGVVYITFQINPDGSVQVPDPQLERTSGKEPLDNAAMSAIHASNPFEPLPRDFHGPYMRFGIYFLYNLPLDYMNNH